MAQVMRPKTAIRRVQAALTPDLLKGRWKTQSHPLEGHCYVAAEALWHLLGCSDWMPVCASYTDSGGRATHWWLKQRRTGRIEDPTREQYLPSEPPYHLGRGTGFLTRQPSRRAQIVLDRVQLTSRPGRARLSHYANHNYRSRQRNNHHHSQ